MRIFCLVLATPFLVVGELSFALGRVAFWCAETIIGPIE